MNKEQERMVGIKLNDEQFEKLARRAKENDRTPGREATVIVKKALAK